MKNLLNNLFANVRKVIAPGIICMLLFAVVSCESAKDPYASNGVEETEEEATSVSFTEFSLSGISCEWVCAPIETESELIIINSDEELRSHIICARESDLPVIDFSRYTLLLARGRSGNSDIHFDIKLQKISPQSYEMSFGLLQNLTDLASACWNVAIITAKLNEDDNIELNVTLRF